jgi:uncharacterized protein (TIGR02996 family)
LSSYDAAGLFRAILAAPDDDLPRLHYADVIEPREPERAEFIRVQCGIAAIQREWNLAPRTITDAYWLAKNAALRRRERELGEAYPNVAESPHNYLDVWAGDAAFGVARRGGHVEFSRGFPSRLTLSWADWHRHAAALLAACPIAHARDGRVRLTTWPAFNYNLIEHPAGGWTFRRRTTHSPHVPEYPGVRFELPAASTLDVDDFTYLGSFRPPANPWPGHPVEDDLLAGMADALGRDALGRVMAEWDAATPTYPPLVTPRP